MRAVRPIVLAILAASIAGVANAQPAEPALSALELAVACAPPPSLDLPDKAPHVLGTQDTVSRSLFDRRDLLVLDTGAQSGIQLGQKYYIRRPIYAEANRRRVRGISTLGWLSIVAVNDTTAIGTIEHFCGGVTSGDFLEAYAPPSLPAGADRDETGGELDFSTLGRVLMGAENHSAVGIGNLMLIDRGEDQGFKAGSRFAVYRDVRVGGMPLTSVGEGVVLSIGKTMSLARITRSRDAVIPGDYVVPRK